MSELHDRAREAASKLLRGEVTGDDTDDFARALLAYLDDHPNVIQLAYLQELLDERTKERDEARAAFHAECSTAEQIAEETGVFEELCDALRALAVELRAELRERAEAHQDLHKRLSAIVEMGMTETQQRALAGATDVIMRLEAERDSVMRECERWRHGYPVEGDYVCPDSLRADMAEKERDELNALWAESDKRLKDLLTEARAERDAARAVLREVEWSDTATWWDGDGGEHEADACPVCRALRESGAGVGVHLDDCALARNKGET